MAEAVRTEPEEEEEELLPARQVDVRRSVRVGLLGGLTAVFLSGVGMIQSFDQAGAVIGPLSLGELLLLGVPFVFGLIAGQPPPVLKGFAEPTRGGRNVVAGAVAALLVGAVMVVFVVLVDTFDVRDVLTRVSPQLLEILTYGQSLAVGVLIGLVLDVMLGVAGGASHLLGKRWRGPLVRALVVVLMLGVLEALVSQILRGARMGPVQDALYAPTGELRPVSAIVIGLIVFGVGVLLRIRPPKVRARMEALEPDRRRAVVAGGLVAAIAVLAILPWVLGPFLTEVLNIAGIFLLMALGLNIVVGFAGLLDLGYVAFFAVGAYAAAVFTSPASNAFAPELSFWVALPIVMLCAVAAGLLVGTPVLRMRGDYLAIVTLGFGEIARILFLSDALKPVFGGAQGILRIPDLSVGPIELQGPELFFYAILAFVLLAAYIAYALQDSRIGRAWMAMREDESVAEAMGVNTVAAKLWAFVIGAMLASFGGALFGVKVGSVFPNSFNVIVSFTVLIIIIIGGLASIPGVVVGALVLVALPELLREFQEFRYLLYGALLIAMMLLRPEGLIPSRRRARELHEEELEQDAWVRAQAETASTAAGTG
jgi:branched-chain amino acid transport system permease protein